MAETNAWLAKQRKVDLSELAIHVGLNGVSQLKKSDLEAALDDHIRANSTKLKNDPELEPYFKRAPSSPAKRESGGATAVEEKRPKRRQTKAREEIEQGSEPEASTALATRTPRTSLAFARKIALPPSPAVLAERFETQTTNVRSSLSTYYSTSRVPSTLSTVRTNLSSVVSIELLALGVEAWGLRSEVLPLRYLTTLPAVPAIGTGELAIKIPDLFALLTLGFWGPVGLWLLTSVGFPLLGAYFINLGSRRYDPVSFNIVKGLVAWIAYAKGGIGGESPEVVQRGVPGGTQGLLISAGIGVIASIYDAVLKK